MRRYMTDYFRFLGITAICAVMLMSCSSEKDTYLRSLKLDTELLTAVDSINIDQYDLFQVKGVVKIDNEWLLMSTDVARDYYLLFLNISRSEHFLAIRKGRGPGEMISGGDLHKHDGKAVFYDDQKAVCIKINAHETIKRHQVVADTIGLFTSGPSKPTFMTTCGKGGFISGNLIDEDVWYSYYDSTGRIVSGVEALNFEEVSNERDARMSFSLSSKYVASPDGTKVCVANVASPSLSFSNVSSGLLSEYKRWAIPPDGMIAGHCTPEYTSAFSCIAADDNYVYVIYSGHKLRNDVLPSDECNHLIVYGWDGNPQKHFYLDHNVRAISVDGKELWATSTYPESCVYKFILP